MKECVLKPGDFVETNSCYESKFIVDYMKFCNINNEYELHGKDSSGCYGISNMGNIECKGRKSSTITFLEFKQLLEHKQIIEIY